MPLNVSLQYPFPYKNLDGTSGTSVFGNGTFSGNVTIGGTLVVSGTSSLNNIALGQTITTVTANNQITTWTSASTSNQIIKDGGSSFTGVKFVLPVTTTLLNGQEFNICDAGSVATYGIYFSDATTILAQVAPGSNIKFTCENNASNVVASWNLRIFAPAYQTSGDYWTTQARSSLQAAAIGNTFAGSGKFTTMQLTTSMATAGVLKNDTSGNITSTLGPLALGIGGTGVQAGFGTAANCVMLADSANFEHYSPLCANTTIGGISLWGAGMCMWSRYQTTGTSITNSTTTDVTFDTSSTVRGLTTQFTYSAPTFSYQGSKSVSCTVSASVGLGTIVAGQYAIYIVPSFGPIVSAAYSAVNHTAVAHISATIAIGPGGTFKIQVYQDSGGSITTTTGQAANCTSMSLFANPV